MPALIRIVNHWIGCFLLLMAECINRADCDAVHATITFTFIDNRWHNPSLLSLTHIADSSNKFSIYLLNRHQLSIIRGIRKWAFPGLIPYSLFQRVLTSLLKEGVPVKDLETILETMIDVVSETGLPVKDIDTIVEHIRTALKRTITRMYCEDGSMKVITLDSELERTMVSSIAKGEGGYYLALNPDLLQGLIRQMAEQLRKFNGFTQNPVILTSQIMRVHFYRLIEQFYPKVRVLSFNEVANNVQIQSIGSLKLEGPGLQDG